MQSLIDLGFKGNIYPVNSNGDEVLGSKIYPSIKDVPDEIDYVISAIPAQYTSQLVADCASKGVKIIHLFAAGFSEIEDEKGGQLESEIVEAARKDGMRIIGPNCMGVYYPKTGLSFTPDSPKRSGFSKQSGPLGLIAQSGGNCTYCIREATTRGIYFSKAINYGNAADINETDLLEYLTRDPETKTIAAYIEGVKDGSRFIKVLREATRVKPVIIFKAGTTEAGTRAAASHTSAIAGSNTIWGSLLKQTGAIQVHNIEEMVDIALLFSCISPPKGKNAAVIGVGGGASVQAADDCSNAGLTLPMLPPQIRQKLKDIYAPEAGDTGRIFKNPIDMFPFTGSVMLLDAIKIIADWDQVDLLIIHLAFDSMPLIDKQDAVRPYIKSILNLKNIINKPIVVALHSQATDEARELASEAHVELHKAGFPVYPSTSRAANAINKLIQYHEWHRRSKQDAS